MSGEGAKSSEASRGGVGDGSVSNPGESLDGTTSLVNPAEFVATVSRNILFTASTLDLENCTEDPFPLTFLINYHRIN
jgi:hypothetical protein